MNIQSLLKPKGQWLIGLLFGATAITGAIAFYGISQFQSVEETSSPPVSTPQARKVTALGRLEPQAEVIHLSAPLALDGDRVAQLLVKEGDRVKAGQVVAILDSRDRLQSALLEAQERVKNAQSKLVQVKAGAKTGELQAQQATIARLQAELQGEAQTQAAEIARWQSEVRTARAEYNRFQQLYRQGAISTSTLDSQRLIAETAQAQLKEAKAVQSRTSQTLQAQLKEAKATLDALAEIRPVDVNVTQTEVDTAIAQMQRAETEVAQAYVRAPMAGQILKIHTRSGEKLSDDGIADLGQIDSMMAVAEVYQTDISKVRVGQSAVITSQAFEGELQGKVALIGLQVSRQNVFSNQPGENLDNRVVEVKIHLTPESSRRVAGLTNLQVDTAILLESSNP